MVLALAAVGEHHRSFSVMRPEFIPQGSVSGLGDTFFFLLFFPSSAGHLPKSLVGGFLSAWIKLGKSLLAYEYISPSLISKAGRRKFLKRMAFRERERREGGEAKAYHWE